MPFIPSLLQHIPEANRKEGENIVLPTTTPPQVIDIAAPIFHNLGLYLLISRCNDTRNTFGAKRENKVFLKLIKWFQWNKPF